MRKFYISLMALAFSASAIGQKAPVQKKSYTQSKKYPVTQFVSDNIEIDEAAPAEPKPNLPISSQAKSMLLWEQVIGYSTYDNQSNNSDQHRIFVADDQQVHATWTQSYQNNTTWTDRGTGYNSGAGYVWNEIPYDRLETVRTGWPGLVKTNDGGEAYVCHTGTGAISFAKRATVGTGAWTITTIPTALPNDFLWPRASVDGNTIHVIALSAPTGLDGALLGGVDGNIAYWRSDDNGATWAVQDHIFSQISADEYSNIESDSYAMDARDGKVSIAIFSELHDGMLITSDDNGDTWSSTIFMDFPIAGYVSDDSTDVGSDGIMDTIMSTDGVGAILIDGNGNTHLTFGEFVFTDDTEGDSLYTVFLTDRLLYWNSTYATDEIYVIGSFEESANDANTTNDITVAQSPDYRCSLASMPTMAEDADGLIYVVFSAADEEYLSDQVFRHLYAVVSDDGGTTWAAQTELTPDADVQEFEYTFPSMAKTIDEKIHIVAQRDYEPGLIVRGDLDGSTENEIIYLAVTTDLDITINTKEIAPKGSFNVYPNPSTGLINISGENISGMSLKLYDASGKEMLSTRTNKGSNQTFDLSFLPNGRYTMAIGNGNDRMTKEILINK
jgi:hypothetical protein